MLDLIQNYEKDTMELEDFMSWIENWIVVIVYVEMSKNNDK